MTISWFLHRFRISKVYFKWDFKDTESLDVETNLKAVQLVYLKGQQCESSENLNFSVNNHASLTWIRMELVILQKKNAVEGRLKLKSG